MRRSNYGVRGAKVEVRGAKFEVRRSSKSHNMPSERLCETNVDATLSLLLFTANLRIRHVTLTLRR